MEEEKTKGKDGNKPRREMWREACWSFSSQSETKRFRNCTVLMTKKLMWATVLDGSRGSHCDRSTCCVKRLAISIRLRVSVHRKKKPKTLEAVSCGRLRERKKQRKEKKGKERGKKSTRSLSHRTKWKHEELARGQRDKHSRPDEDEHEALALNVLLLYRAKNHFHKHTIPPHVLNMSFEERVFFHPFFI